MYFKSIAHSILILMTVIYLSFGIHSTAVAGADQQCKMDIRALLDSYQSALNSSDVDRIMPLYSEDGAFMPANKPTSVGQVQVKTAYQHVFKAIDLDIEFHIDEIERQGDIAFVRTSSDGEITLLNDNIVVKNNTRELFVMKRVNDEWKIHQYMFNKISPPTH